MYFTIQKSKTNNDEKYKFLKNGFASCFNKNIFTNVYSTF